MELDDAYANAAYIPGADAFPSRWAKAAADFRDALGDKAECDVSYGPSLRQVYDLFRPDGSSRGLFVFVHGGYWLRFDKSFWSHLAAGMRDTGWTVAMPSYDLCPGVRIADITKQIATAIGAMAARVDGPIILAGHSAGGHLVARMACKGVLPDDLAARLAYIMPISPVADLRPLLRTSMNDSFAMSEADAIAESPALISDRHEVPATVWVGADERPAFLDQARWLGDAWRAPVVVDRGKHHFDVIDALADSGGSMVQKLTQTE